VTSDQGQLISDNEFLLPSHPNSARYTIVHNSPTEFFLEIRDVTLADGGSYVCLNGNSGPPEVFSGQAELIVLDTERPNCTTQVQDTGVVQEGQNYTTTCWIVYRGGFSPTMTWTGPEPYREATVVTPTDIFSGVAYTIDRGMDTRAFRCVTNFTEPAGVPEGVASNAPTYNYIHQFGQMFVYWGPKNMYAVPMRTNYEVGDQITCYADAHPTAFYLWQNMRDLENTNGQVYTIKASDLGHMNFSLRCQAQNLIQGFLMTGNLFIFINVPPITPPTTAPVTSPPTTPPPSAGCTDLTGWWLSEDPYAEMYIQVSQDMSGRVLGFMRNHTDQHWVEIIGRTRTSDFSLIGLTSIWPYEIGVTGMAAECHNCFGSEAIMTSGAWRSYTDSMVCGDGGTPAPHIGYVFNRVTIEPRSIHHPDFKIYEPTRLVSGRLGITHLHLK